MARRQVKLKCHTWMDSDQVAKVVEQATIGPKKQAALLVEAEAKRSMISGGKRRMKNKKGKTVVREEPSEPGQPPHSQSGVGSASIKTATDNEGTTYVVGPQSPPASYMAIHEFGGRYHPPRPFMRPALMRVLPKFPSLFGNLELNKQRAAKTLERDLKKWQRDKKRKS